jgi:pimeloyl-ACP methyl ester carboxylesterase
MARITRPHMITTRGDGVDLRCAVWEGQGSTLLAVHGLTANCRCWDTLAEALTPRHRVLALDLRGRGGSGRPGKGYSLEHHVGDILALVEDLHPAPLVLMGHSLGAFISLAFAARYPHRVRGLVLVDGGGRLSPEQMRAVMAAIAPSLERLGRVFPSAEAYLAVMACAAALQPWNAALETCFRYELETVEGGVRCNIQPAHILEEAAHLAATDVSACYPAIACPTLILRAACGLLQEGDRLLPGPALERMLASIPGAGCVAVDGVNHYGIVFQPHRARDAAVREFLARLGDTEKRVRPCPCDSSAKT